MGDAREELREHALQSPRPDQHGERKNLKVAWTFSTGVNRGQEAAPIVVGDTMYVVTPYPNILYALDLKNPGATRWKYEPDPASAAQGVACCDVINRGAAYADGKVFFNTLDNYTVAVDAATGKEVWKTQLGNINKGETMTMSPLVVKGKVLVGNSGGEMGVRGWLTALNAASGKIAWRAYSTGPDAECLIGANFKPFYESDRGKDLGVSTWPPDAWKTGGGTVWGWISYDAEQNLIFYGTGTPGPWNPAQRPGDNKWSAGIFARNPNTGEALWFYQWSPHDPHDYDGVNEQILLDMPVGGQPRKVPRPPRTQRLRLRGREGLAAVGFLAAHGPRLHAAQPPLRRRRERRDRLHRGQPYVGMNTKMYAGPGGHRGEFTAWDPAAGRAVWKLKEKFPVWSGAAATAGDVVFYGTMDGYFKAVHGRTGDVLWQFKVGSGIIAQPVTYRGPDGKQYVAILSGVGGWAGAIVVAGLDPRDPTAALGFVNAMSDLPDHTTKGGTLYVFSLP